MRRVLHFVLPLLTVFSLCLCFFFHSGTDLLFPYIVVCLSSFTQVLALSLDRFRNFGIGSARVFHFNCSLFTHPLFYWLRRALGPKTGERLRGR